MIKFLSCKNTRQLISPLWSLRTGKRGMAEEEPKEDTAW